MTTQDLSVPHTLHIHRILLPIEGSALEDSAVACAAILAVALRASITVVHVDERPSSMVGIVHGASVEGDLAAERVMSTDRLDKTVADLGLHGVADATALRVVASGVASTLLELVRRERFDLIVMATHARTGMSRALLGSVTEQVLRGAKCPVLTVHTT